MKNLRNIKYTKHFLISMFSTFLLLILFTAFAVIEKNAENVICDTPKKFFSLNLNSNDIKLIKIRFMGKDFLFYL